MKVSTKAKCPECDRVFDLTDEDDASEFYYGHDCEVGDILPDKAAYPTTGLRTAAFAWDDPA